MKRRTLWYLLAGLLLVAVAAASASAGTLTAGSYTYILKGRDLDLPVDVLTIQGATLLPEDLVVAMGIRPVTQDDTVRLERGPVEAELRFGSATAQIEGRPRTLSSGPVKIAGHLFIPADALTYLGVTTTVEGKYVLLDDFVPAGPDAASLQQSPAFASNWNVRTLENIVRNTTGGYGQITITALSADLLQDAQLDMPWGTRMRLQSLLDSQTLLLVTLKNTSLRTIALDPTKLLMTDDKGHQYDYLKTEIAVDGQVTSTLAPGAIRTSVLVYDRAAGPITLYYEPVGDVLGKVTGP